MAKHPKQTKEYKLFIEYMTKNPTTLVRMYEAGHLHISEFYELAVRCEVLVNKLTLEIAGDIGNYLNKRKG